ncbi:hypothetical protein C357_00749 [Citreicella sp. 357]|nr:hypothetical protein C357_00749 [Citreicella sp. 357]
MPDSVRWEEKDWTAWLEKSDTLVGELATLNVAGKRKERNELIDANRAHWGKLKPWLLTLSNGKCWFSEVRELYSHYDVEHFRPKKEAKELDGAERDGYWWLSFDYMNFRVCGNVGNRKKGGWFPLHQGSHCSTFDAPCEESEARYLLDPIDDVDVSLIAFDEEGKAVPTPGTTAWEQDRVKETINRLKLNEHAPLAGARRDIWQKINRLIKKYYMAKARCGQGNNEVAKERLREVRSCIREMTATSAELSSVARWCVLLRNDPQLSLLVG